MITLTMITISGGHCNTTRILESESKLLETKIPRTALVTLMHSLVPGTRLDGLDEATSGLPKYLAKQGL